MMSLAATGMIVLYLSGGEAAKSYPFNFRNKRIAINAVRLLASLKG